MRVRKSDATTGTTYYLRSSVLGGQVVGQLVNVGGVWQWNQGYVYLGGQLLATQHYGVNFVHEDPITKSKRVTDISGNVLSTVETDPWGADTSRSGNAAFQPRKFTSYERDANGSDEAMFRRYNRRHGRFDQPDPYEGSYNLSNPQSFNRYAYVGNDPVNFVDPSGLFAEGPPKTTPDPGRCYALFVDGVEVGTWGNCGASGIGPQQPVQQQGPVAKFDHDKLDKCLNDLFKVDMDSFTGSRTGGGFAGSRKGRKFKVGFDTTSYTRKGLVSLAAKYGKRLSSPPFGIAVEGLDKVFVGSNFASDPNVVDEAVTATEVHELGNFIAIKFLRNPKTYPKAKSAYLRGIDSDAGMALEECVFGGYVDARTGITLY